MFAVLFLPNLEFAHSVKNFGLRNLETNSSQDCSFCLNSPVSFSASVINSIPTPQVFLVEVKIFKAGKEVYSKSFDTSLVRPGGVLRLDLATDFKPSEAGDYTAKLSLYSSYKDTKFYEMEQKFTVEGNKPAEENPSGPNNNVNETPQNWNENSATLIQAAGNNEGDENSRKKIDWTSIFGYAGTGMLLLALSVAGILAALYLIFFLIKRKGDEKGKGAQRLADVIAKVKSSEPLNLDEAVKNTIAALKPKLELPPPNDEGLKKP